MLSYARNKTGQARLLHLVYGLWATGKEFRSSPRNNEVILRGEFGSEWVIVHGGANLVPHLFLAR
jgi:hypothetical protein